MNAALKKFDKFYFVLGRFLLGLYFFLPGVSKIMNYSGTAEVMLSKNVPFTSLLLPLVIVLQVGLGLMLMAGKQLRISSLILFGLTIMINVFIHNFWALQGEPGYMHEIQNFVKNLGIAAGLLVLASKQTD